MDVDAGRSLGRLAEQVIKRRIDLGMSKRNVSEAAEISINTYQRVEAGMPVRDITYARIEQVFSWAAGSCMAIIKGVSGPVVLASNGNGLAVAAIPEEDLTDAVQSAFVAVSDDLTAAQIRDLSRKVVEELKRRGRL